ncbi:MAG: hypothetical protein SWX82_24160 [Cyanobacteriota bacterium]|nr:hypothetical protein [Cyanobacteriota bacterium]
MKVAFLTSIRQLYRPLWQLLLLDNSYCSADERSPWEGNYYYWTIVIALLMSDRPGKAIITIGQ